MCYEEETLDAAASSIFGARIMLHFGIGSEALAQCQNFPVCLCEHKYTAVSGKAVFKRAFRCNDEHYDLVLSMTAIGIITRQLRDNKKIKNPPELRLKTGRNVFDPAYIRCSVLV